MSNIETKTLTAVTLAATYKTGQNIDFPMVISPKLDGIRVFIEDGVAYSRNGKPIRNRDIQTFFSSGVYDGFDGEMLSGEHDSQVFRRSTSVVMKASGGSNWTFWVFDYMDPSDKSFTVRYQIIHDILRQHKTDKIKVVPQILVKNFEAIDRYEAEFLDSGYEGAMLKDPKSTYENKRTKSLLKLKRFSDAEATIVGYEPMVRIDGFVEDDPKTGMLGKFMLQRPDGLIFGCGSGYTHEERKKYWQIKNKLIKSKAKVTYKFFNQGGYDAPRFPVYKGIREDI